MSQNNYIWHCNNPKCNGNILFKTEKPILDNGCIKCCFCGTMYDFKEIERMNPQNLKKYYKNL